MEHKCYTAAIAHLRAARKALHDATKAPHIPAEECIFLQPIAQEVVNLFETLESAEPWLTAQGLLR